MIKTPKKSLKLKNKRLLGELELTDHADTEQAVSADFNTTNYACLKLIFK